jgi:replicative DNA helicase
MALIEMDRKGLSLSMMALAAEVNRGLPPGEPIDARWQGYGGCLYVSQLPDKPCSAALFEECLEELWKFRQQRELANLAQDGAEGVDIAAKLKQTLQRKRGGEARPIKEIIPLALDSWEKAMEHPGRPSGIRSGLVDLDRVTWGWQPEDLIVMAARPSQGKTSLLLGFALHAAVVDRVPTAFFTAESSSVSIVKRAVCWLSGTDQSRWRAGQPGTSDFAAMTSAAGKLGSAPIHIVDCQNLTISQIASKAQDLQERHGIRLFCADYLQKIKSDTAHEKRTYEVAQVSEGLKLMAVERKSPVITACQLNRESEKTKGRMAGLGDLADSSSIEKDADIVGIIHRDKDGPCLNIAKFRDGPLALIRLAFLPHCARFENAARIDRADVPYKDD